MQSPPKVSFICSVKDGFKDIRRCAMSVLRQTLEDIELILVDDHSSDSTWEEIRSLASTDGRVRAVKNQGKEGLTYSLNIGLDFARGEYVARIDADDFAHGNRAVKQAALLDSNPKAAMASSCNRVIDEEDWELYCHCPSCSPSLLRWSLCFRNNIRHSSVMWRRSIDVRYEPAFPYAQDYELWCRISRIGDIVVVPEVLTTVRNSPSSITSTKHEEQEIMADRVSAEQYEHYTGARMTPVQSRHLRMIHHMKSPEQFRVFDNMTPYDFRQAVERYCRLAEAFHRKEKPDTEEFMRDLGHDISSLMSNTSRMEDAAKSIAAMSRLFGRSSISSQIEKRFVDAHIQSR